MMKTSSPGWCRRLWSLTGALSLKPLLRPIGEKVVEHLVYAAATDHPDLLPGPLVVSGFHDEPTGIGRAARMTSEGLKAAGFAPREAPLRPLVSSGSFGSVKLDEGDGGVWIIHANPHDAFVALSRVAIANWNRRYRIGIWAYELPNAPNYWKKAAKLFHEIWVPSRFVADALNGCGTLVKVVPHFIADPVCDDRTNMRNRLGIPIAEFVVGAAADLRSSATRKNVLGSIEIFCRAFPVPTDQWLVLKISGVKEKAEAFNEIINKTLGRKNILILDKQIDENEMEKLINTWDIFLSPHRSEGFGLVIAECLARQKPVIATGWSGNLDYMEGLDSMLIPYRLSPVRDRDMVYSPNAVDRWAEPDIDIAVRMLQTFYEDRSSLANVSKVGKAHIEEIRKMWLNRRFVNSKWFSLIRPQPSPVLSASSWAGR